MTEISYYVAMSIDGYIADSQGGVEWLMPFQNSGNDYGYTAFNDSIQALVMGSHTYEQSISFGEKPNGRPWWVFSTRELEPISPQVTITSAPLQEVVAEIAANGIARIWLLGGAKLAAGFAEAGLITEYYLALIPVLLGSGIPLLTPHSAQTSLQLQETKSHTDGVVLLRYLAETKD